MLRNQEPGLSISEVRLTGSGDGTRHECEPLLRFVVGFVGLFDLSVLHHGLVIEKFEFWCFGNLCGQEVRPHRSWAIGQSSVFITQANPLFGKRGSASVANKRII